LATNGQDKRGDRQDSQPKPPIFKEITGGFGGRHARGDLALVRHAIREDWPLEEEKRVALMRFCLRVIRAKISHRVAISVAHCVLEADKANLRAEAKQSV
jgi:hypothetical protein